MSVWEGAVAMRREAFAYADGWPAPFWYAHEGIELAWRVWDGGWHVRYDGTIEVFHPAITPTRHPEFYRFQARNRVWLARRNLPLPVGLLYVLSWVLVGGVRLRTKPALRETVRGYQLGLTEECGLRRPMSWRTVWPPADHLMRGEGPVGDRDWQAWAIAQVEADANRTSDTHLHVFPLPPDWGVRLYLKDE